MIPATMIEVGVPTLAVVAQYVVRAMAAALLLYSLIRLYLHLSREAAVPDDISSSNELAGGGE